MSPRIQAVDESASERPIAYHYVLVMIVEAVVLSGLAWLANHYR